MFECVRETKDGALIEIHVVPGSKSSGFSYESWEKRLRVKVSSPAVKRKANKEVIAIFSRLFGCCELVSGAASRKKSLLVQGKNLKEVGEILDSLVN